MLYVAVLYKNDRQRTMLIKLHDVNDLGIMINYTLGDRNF